MSQQSSNPSQRQSFLFKSANLIGGLSLVSSSLFWTPVRANDTVTIPEAAPETSEPAAPSSPRPSAAANPAPLAAPKVSASSPRQEPTLQTVPTQVPTIPPLSRQGQNSFIDTTSYQQEAPPRLAAPTKVVLTERSSGCQAISQNGQLRSGNCGQVMPKRLTLATLKPEPPRAIAQNPRPLNTFSSREAVATARPSLSQKAIAAQSYRTQSYRTNTVMSQVVGLAPIARRGLNIALEPLTEYNRATSLYSPAPANLNRTDLLFPLPVLASISSAFGWRIHPVTGTTRMHEGTDLAAAEGTPVLAAYAGEVATAEYSGGYGLMVILRHLNGEQESRYGHLSEIFVRPGETVQQGAVIGLVGSTGLSTGPHLHFEWRHLTQDGWVAVDAGQHLEWAMANLVQSLQVAQLPKQSEQSEQSGK
jgi:murein DD-endopeptidase MepM/ murein hydrolase activator NlpD